MEKRDIDALVSGRVPEGPTIDYKESLGDLDSEKSKSEFLRDVSSFANTAGGIIYFGIKEERDDKNQPTGFPAKALGLAGFNHDGDVTRILNIVATGIEPRIGISPEVIQGDFPNGPILALHVHQSWAGPHMTRDGRFFVRDDRAKRPMDYHMIRSSFISFLSLNEAVRSFQRSQATAILAGNAPVTLGSQGTLVIHAMPISAFVPATVKSIPLVELRQQSNRFGFVGGVVGQPNLDGLLIYQRGAPDYVQMFRNGIMERAVGEITGTWEGEPVVYGPRIIETVTETVRGFLVAQRELGLEAPVVVTMVAQGVHGHKLVHERQVAHPKLMRGWQRFDRDELWLPDRICDDLDGSLDSLVNELLVIFWQAAGFDEGPST
jgi:hypothetical protein